MAFGCNFFELLCPFYAQAANWRDGDFLRATQKVPVPPIYFSLNSW